MRIAGIFIQKPAKVYMPIHDTNDAGLRTLIFDHPKVIVKFTKEQCTICERMAGIYSQLAENPTYREITFLRMDAKENPVSSKEVNMTGAPFFATYLNGLLNQCSLLSDKEALKEMLGALQMAEAD